MGDKALDSALLGISVPSAADTMNSRTTSKTVVKQNPHGGPTRMVSAALHSGNFALQMITGVGLGREIVRGRAAKALGKFRGEKNAHMRGERARTLSLQKNKGFYTHRRTKDGRVFDFETHSEAPMQFNRRQVQLSGGLKRVQHKQRPYGSHPAFESKRELNRMRDYGAGR